MIKTRQAKVGFIKYLFFAGVIASLIVGGFVYYSSVKEQGPIYEFSYERDAKDILKIFDENWYWLLEPTREEYSPDFIIKHRTFDEDPRHFGKMAIKVLRVQNRVAGFITYYSKSFLRGCILFLGVDKAFRRKGYAAQLVKYALDDMFLQGKRIVTLSTRTDNAGARTLYNKFGFKEVSFTEDGKFVDFELRKK